MLDVIALPAFRDNYIWVIRDADGNALVVDPGDAQPVIEYIEQQDLTLRGLLITHHHPDHVGGVQALHERFGMPVYGPDYENIPCLSHPLRDGDQLTLEQPALQFDVFHLPGHTLGHIAFYAARQQPPLLFCGDTLFAAGCGRLFEGTPQQMLASLDRLAALPDDTRVYCAHEYTLSNLAFARAVTPDDPAVLGRISEVEALRAENIPSVPSTLAEEKRSNPFMRVDSEGVQAGVAAHSGATRSREDTFAALRAWKDSF